MSSPKTTQDFINYLLEQLLTPAIIPITTLTAILQVQMQTYRH